MHDGLPYGVHGEPRLQRRIREKETEGRPQDLPEKLEAFYPPCVGGPERETGAWAGSLRISARGRPAAGCHGGTERAGIGALVASAPFFLPLVSSSGSTFRVRVTA